METAPATKPWVGIVALLAFLGSVAWLAKPGPVHSVQSRVLMKRAQLTGLQYEPFLATYFGGLGLRISAQRAIPHSFDPASNSFGIMLQGDTVVGRYRVNYHYVGTSESPHSMRLSFQLCKGFAVEPIYTKFAPSRSLLNLLRKATTETTTVVVDTRQTSVQIEADGTTHVEFQTALPAVGIGSLDVDQVRGAAWQNRQVHRNILSLVAPLLDNCEVRVLTYGDEPRLATAFGIINPVSKPGTGETPFGTKVGQVEIGRSGDYFNLYPRDDSFVNPIPRVFTGAKFYPENRVVAGKVEMGGPFYEFPNGILMSDSISHLFIRIPAHLVRDPYASP